MSCRVLPVLIIEINSNDHITATNRVYFMFPSGLSRWRFRKFELDICIGDFHDGSHLFKHRPRRLCDVYKFHECSIHLRLRTPITLLTGGSEPEFRGQEIRLVLSRENILDSTPSARWALGFLPCKNHTENPILFQFDVLKIFSKAFFSTADLLPQACNTPTNGIGI